MMIIITVDDNYANDIVDDDDDDDDASCFLAGKPWGHTEGNQTNNFLWCAQVNSFQFTFKYKFLLFFSISANLFMYFAPLKIFICIRHHF